MKKIVAGLLLLFLPVTSGWAGFDEGAVAYTMGQYGKALEILVPLAESADHPYAQYYLGVMYTNGQGVKQDFAEAAKWYSRAAKQGISQAQFRLGEIYAKGQGVPADPEQAYAWFAVAAQLGHAQASAALGSSSQKLSPAELAQAKKLSSEFIQQYGNKPPTLP
jgi:TPR repeat protein